MSWFSRLTRFGDMHIVYGQEKDNSCGMASIMMTFFKTYKLTPGTQAVYAEERVIKAYETAKGGAHDFTRNGAIDNVVLRTINALDGNRWAYKAVPGGTGMGALVADKVGVRGLFGPSIDVSPVMLGITWSDGTGHWVVVDTVRKVFGDLTATVCDPWDTNVHMQDFSRGGVFSYRPIDGGLTWSIGSNKGQSQPYGKTTSGIADAIIYKA